MSESEKERPTIKDNPTAWFEIDTNVMVFVTLMFVICLILYAIWITYFFQNKMKEIYSNLSFSFHWYDRELETRIQDKIIKYKDFNIEEYDRLKSAIVAIVLNPTLLGTSEFTKEIKKMFSYV